jgi:ParB-like chromosome segregation protein Spo0J
MEQARPETRRIKIADIKIPDVRVNSILTEEQKALLKSTIEQVGVVQDPVVRQLEEGGYELIAGKSRMGELQAQGATDIDVKVIVVEKKLALIMNITENIARGSYEYISVARAIRELRALGSTPEELQKVFPWRAQWIDFIEGLQDLPEDVQEAIRAHKLTPTHVQAALVLPTPAEVHSGLQTAYKLGWDSATLRTYAQNRAEEIAAAKKKSEEQGQPLVIPQANPGELVQYRQCLGCGYKKPSKTITIQLLCEDCLTLIKYLTSQVGPPEEAITTVYAALAFYHGQQANLTMGFGLPPPPPREEPSPE